MAPPVSTLKRKRVSKNKKKNWRKHVNIDDVEEYLDDKRLQERTGGIVADKSDDALFFIEKSAENNKPLTLKRRNVGAKKRRIDKNTPLKCFSKLQASSSVKAPKVSRRDQPKSMKTDQRDDKRINKMASTIRRHSERMRSKKDPLYYNLWSEDAVDVVFRKKFSVEGKVDTKVDPHFLRQTRKMDVKIPNTGTLTSKPSSLASVEVPHPGASYNPSYDDHQELLQLANKIEIGKDKAEKKITNALDAHFPRATKTEIEASHLKEMSAGMFNNEGEDDDEESKSCGLSYNPPVRREDKKTITQRNKEKRLKEKQQKIMEAKMNKSRKQELLKLKQIKSEIRQKENKTAERQTMKAERKRKSLSETKKLGKMKFEQPDVEIKLSEELEGSLRMLKPEGHLLVDRFKSLQKRNLIESREKVKQKRKYKLKSFEKKSHQEVTI